VIHHKADVFLCQIVKDGLGTVCVPQEGKHQAGFYNLDITRFAGHVEKHYNNPLKDVSENV